MWGWYLPGVTLSASTWSPTLRSAISYPPDDVGPDGADDPVAVLVVGDGLEDVEALAVFLVDLGALGGGRDLVAGASRLLSLEDLSPVDHPRDVDAHLGIEH